MPKIVKVTSTEHGVDVTLDTGLVISLAPNEEYIHFHFSGLKGKFIEVVEQGANNINIGYHREA